MTRPLALGGGGPGVRHPNAEVLARLGRGEAVDGGESTFRTQTQIETAAPIWTG
jgi:hypothetical protein